MDYSLNSVPRNQSRWRPISLRTLFLLIVIILPLGLSVIILVLLERSLRNGGVVSFNDINDVPGATQFLFLYLPTVLAVMYSLLWAWIDLDVRRLEPYYQLSRNAGASGKESLLLHYPVDLLASVPIKAFKSKHITVFITSLATVFVFWGITPTQAGIFAVDNVLRVQQMPLMSSSGLLSAAQRGNLSVQSAYSTVSIMWLNETLQPFMTRDFFLAPFSPKARDTIPRQNETWTGTTQLFSINVTCEDPLYYNTTDDVLAANSSWGCSFTLPPPNLTKDSPAGKYFTMVYVGWDNNEGSADYYLSNGACPKNESRTFLVQTAKALVPLDDWNEMSPAEQRANADVTAQWCRSTYFAHEVKATISIPSMAVLDHEIVGPAIAIPEEVFNATSFEADMSNGRGSAVRIDFPTVNWPDQTSFLLDTPLNTQSLSKMSPFAVGATQLPMDAYLNGDTLADAYQAAYRLLFSRHMAEVFSGSDNQTSAGMGQQQFTTQAFVVVPAFAYTVTAFLVVTALIAASILWISRKRNLALDSDPGTIAELMSLTANDSRLIDGFKELDRSSLEQLNSKIGDLRYKLLRNQNQNLCIRQLLSEENEDMVRMSESFAETAKIEHIEREADGLRPLELRFSTGIIFFAMQLLLFVLLAVLFVSAKRNDGLPLPSQSRFVRQLLENYLPTALGALIEPFWLVLNRHLCLLIPFDSLRKGHQQAEKSISLSYNSLPPQMMIWEAIKNRHFLLSSVCSMALLANLLSIALSGLFNEVEVLLKTSSDFNEQQSLRFVALNGSGPPFTTTSGGTLEPLYIALSNVTAQTPLPPWTDQDRFYLPFSSSDTDLNITSTQRATRPFLSASLECTQINSTDSFRIAGAFEASDGTYVDSNANLTLEVEREDGSVVTCGERLFGLFTWDFTGMPQGQSAFEFNTGLDGIANLTSDEDAAYCREFVAAGWGRTDVTSVRQISVDESYFNLSTVQTTAIICHPILTTGLADVETQLDGHIVTVHSVENATTAAASMFTTSISDLLGQAHQYLFDRPRNWHNDSFPSNFNNYLLERFKNGSDFLDPSAAPPSVDEMMASVSRLYSQTFATLIGRNYQRLLEPSATQTVSGFIVQPQTRILISTTMFVIAETILGLYLITTVMLYLRRPWKILARMPDSPASIIAFFAASHALQDFCHTSNLPGKSSTNHLKELDRRYGFGTFVGTDGKVHAGIERHPLVATYKRENTLLSLAAVEDEKLT